MEMTNYRVFGSCEIEIASPCTLIIFGGHGDLAKRKLVPSLYRLFKNNLLSERCLILSADRVENTDECYRERMRGQVKAALPQDFDNASWDRFARVLYYSAFDFGLPESYEALLKQRLTILDEKHGTKGNHIFYLAVPPSVFPIVVGNLEVTGLSALKETGYPYIVVEKPFGRDLDSARALNLSLSECFEERQIFRIDHYIAKETVQNMLIFRFANSIFEPLWTRSFIDHVQITASETLGVEGRAGYYEQSGVLRDMFQSHMFQLLAVTAMEPPVKFDAERVRDEKIKVFRSMRLFDLDHLDETVVTGQYGEGAVRGEILPAYREEPGVSPHSTTPTFAALKVFIDNWRWNGVPFYLRSGKRLSPARQRSRSISRRFPTSCSRQSWITRSIPTFLFSDFSPMRVFTSPFKQKNQVHGSASIQNLWSWIILMRKGFSSTLTNGCCLTVSGGIRCSFCGRKASRRRGESSPLFWRSLNPQPVRPGFRTTHKGRPGRKSQNS
jgi:glucose-6-phosphate 1-dehydrogenase